MTPPRTLLGPCRWPPPPRARCDPPMRPYAHATPMRPRRSGPWLHARRPARPVRGNEWMPRAARPVRCNGRRPHAARPVRADTSMGAGVAANPHCAGCQVPACRMAGQGLSWRVAAHGGARECTPAASARPIRFGPLAFGGCHAACRRPGFRPGSCPLRLPRNPCLEERTLVARLSHAIIWRKRLISAASTLSITG